MVMWPLKANQKYGFSCTVNFQNGVQVIIQYSIASLIFSLGYGLFTESQIEKHEFIVEYSGELITQKQGEIREIE